MAQDWDIRPRAEGCRQCETQFEDRQTCWAALVYDAEGYRRGDYCETCWENLQEEVVPYSSWQGMYSMPPPAQEEALKKETAESLLRKLMEDDDPAKINVIFILAVMLERKKILAEKDVKKADDGSITRIYEHRKTGESFVVPDPRLKLDELESVQEEVVVMLGGKPREKTTEDSEQTTDHGPRTTGDSEQTTEGEKTTNHGPRTTEEGETTEDDEVNGREGAKGSEPSLS